MIGIQYASTDGNPETNGAYIFNLVWETARTYTITIPSTLEVQDSGWNELPGGISASGTYTETVTFTAEVEDKANP